MTATDVLTTSTFGSPSSYADWSGKQAENGSAAVYAGTSTTNNGNIQMRTSDNKSGVVSTTSGGKVKKVTVKWASNTTSGRTIWVFGKNEAYTSSSQLYNDANDGDLLGSIVCGTSTELEITGDYAYVGFRSSLNALYLENVTIEWEAGTPDTYSNYCTTVVAATVARPVITVAENPFMFSTTATITCETEGAAIKYSFDGENWNDYTEALTITATTTIYAKAVKDEDESEVASVTATKNLAVPTVAIDATGITNTNVYDGTEAGSLSASVTYNDEAIEGAVVTWSSSDEAVATINENGVVTLVDEGSVTFTATYEGNEDYKEKTATYVMTVINIDPNAPGTENNPYTVAQAIDYIGTLGSATSATEVYVSGIISQVDGYNSKYSSITYWISDNGSTEDQMEVYSGKGLESAGFSSVNDLQVGDVVTVKGYVKMYNSIPEFDKNNVLVSFKEAVTIGEAGYATYVTRQDVSFPTSVKAYIGSVNGNWFTMTQVTSVPEGTPVVLNGNKGTYTLELATEELDDVKDNELKASNTDITANGNQYVLAKPAGEEIGFYQAEEYSTIAAGKAYLEITGEAPVKAFTFKFGDDATSINEELRMKSEESSIYNVAGQRIQKMQRGINIVNGKKILR